MSSNARRPASSPRSTASRKAERRPGVLSRRWRRGCGRSSGSEAVTDLYTRHMHGDDPLNASMRAVIFRAAARRVGHGLSGRQRRRLQARRDVLDRRRRLHRRAGVPAGAVRRHLRDRRSRVDRAAELLRRPRSRPRGLRRLGPGARRCSARRTPALPVDVPIIQTDLDIKPVRIQTWADIGTNAVILPGRHRRPGAIVGAGAVVTHDVPPFSVVAGRARAGDPAARCTRTGQPGSAAAFRGRTGGTQMDALNLRNARILVTGGAGLIGSHIVDRLIDRIAGRDRRPRQLRPRPPREPRRRRCRRAGSRSSRATSATAQLVTEAMQGIDVVFHQAAIRITQCAEEPALAMDVLVNGTFIVLDAARQAGVRKVVAASSASVYGLADRFPTDEQHHPYNNRTLYGAAKAFNEGLLRSFNEHVRPRVRRAALLQRLRAAHGHATAPTPRCSSAGWRTSRPASRR